VKFLKSSGSVRVMAGFFERCCLKKSSS